jgi:SAM-dependent methyltransferase
VTGGAYLGGELDLFARAENWKAYFFGEVREHLAGDVLEVGSGIGAIMRAFAAAPFRSWLGLEPDPSLVERSLGNLPSGDGRYSTFVGTLLDLEPGRRFDAVLYVDVLEHIGDDRAEMERAAARLAPGGRLVVVSPAHPWLFTPFDAAIGHHRRYTKATLAAAVPAGLEKVRLDYLDAAGLLASAGNRLLLRSAMPTERQILFWDRFLVPVSRRLDPLLGHSLGKSIVGVWRRSA